VMLETWAAIIPHKDHAEHASSGRRDDRCQQPGSPCRGWRTRGRNRARHPGRIQKNTNGVGPAPRAPCPAPRPAAARPQPPLQDGLLDGGPLEREERNGAKNQPVEFAGGGDEVEMVLLAARFQVMVTAGMPPAARGGDREHDQCAAEHDDELDGIQ